MYSLHKKREVGLNCLSKARNYMKLKDWVRAFPHFLMCLELFENERSKFEMEFTEVLEQLGLWLEANNKFTDICKWYLKGLEYFPSNPYILNNFGEQLLRIEEPHTALLYLESAYCINPDILIIEKNITSAKLNILPRWHFRMLNDKRRNRAYKMAISSILTVQYNKVLDIGSGCGLLSFYASLYDVESIVAIEASSVLCSIAKNALSDKVKILNKYSTLLKKGEIEFANVLVTEIFDAGFFGEHVLEILIHAWDNLLLPSAKIIPNTADLFVTAISGTDMLLCHKLKCLSQLGLDDVCVTQRMNEPYEAENLKLKSVVFLSEMCKACTIHLNNVTQLKDIFQNSKAIPSFILKCCKSGNIDAFAIWYNLYMDDNKSLMITTNPQADSVTCWEQAVVYLDHTINVQEGDEIELQISCISNEFQIHILKPLVSCQNCFKISPEAVTFLNDTQIFNACNNFELPEDVLTENFQVLDLNPFPIFSFMLARKGYYKGIYKCVLNDPQDWDFFNYLCWYNGLNQSMFEICSKDKIENFTAQFDLIFIDPISKNGTLNEKTFQQSSILRNALKSHGCIFPKSLNLHLKVIESDYLEQCYKVNDRNLLGYVVAEEINKYSVLEHWEIEPDTFSHHVLGEPDFIDMDLLGADLRGSKEVCVKIREGNPHGILYWFCMNFGVNVVSTLNSVHYNSACFIFQNILNTNSCKDIKLQITHDTGLLKITAVDYQV